jgi:hypothetical protein
VYACPPLSVRPRRGVAVDHSPVLREPGRMWPKNARLASDHKVILRTPGTRRTYASRARWVGDLFPDDGARMPTAVHRSPLSAADFDAGTRPQSPRQARPRGRCSRPAGCSAQPPRAAIRGGRNVPAEPRLRHAAAMIIDSAKRQTACSSNDVAPAQPRRRPRSADPGRSPSHGQISIAATHHFSRVRAATQGWDRRWPHASRELRDRPESRPD